MITFYFDGEDLEYSKAAKCTAVINDRKYCGFADHVIKVTGRCLNALVWEDTFDNLSFEGGLQPAICQTGLEIEGEMTRLAQYRIYPEEYCGILTNGRDWILVSCVVNNGEKFRRHSLPLSTVIKATSGSSYSLDEVAIASVASLLVYAFNCARSISKLIKSSGLIPPSPLPFTPGEPADEDYDSGDDIQEVSDALQNTDKSRMNEMCQFFLLMSRYYQTE